MEPLRELVAHCREHGIPTVFWNKEDPVHFEDFLGTAALFDHVLTTEGHEVVGVDVNPKHVDAVNRGEVPFVEPDLGTHVADVVSQGSLKAQKDTPQADVYIIAVPTPFAERHKADLTYIDAATDSIIPHLQGGSW